MSGDNIDFEAILSDVNMSPHVGNGDNRKRRKGQTCSVDKQPPHKRLRLSQQQESDAADTFESILHSQGVPTTSSVSMDNPYILSESMGSLNSRPPLQNLDEAVEDACDLRSTEAIKQTIAKNIKNKSLKKQSLKKKRRRRGKGRSYGCKRAGLQEQTEEIANILFGKFTPEEGRTQIDNIWKLINDAELNEDFKQPLQSTLAKMLHQLEEKNQLQDKAKEMHDEILRKATEPDSFINNIEFAKYEAKQFPFLSQTFVGRLGKTISSRFNGNYGIVMMALMIFASTFLCHVKFRTSAKYTTNCNIYACAVGPPGTKKTPIASYLSGLTKKVIGEFAVLAASREQYWTDGLSNAVQTGVSSLARNCQLTQQCSGIQTHYADELAQAAQTFQLNKKADDSEGIAFLTSGFECGGLSREFCDTKFICQIERIFISLLILSQPELCKEFISGGKAKMGLSPRCLLSFANHIPARFSSLRYCDKSQISDWHCWIVEHVLKSMFKSLATLLFCNFRSETSKLVLKYSDECALILCAFEWCMQKIRYDYQKLKNKQYSKYDDDFCSSLVKGLTQVDKIIAALYFIDIFAEKPLDDTFDINDEYYFKNVQNGPYTDYTFYVDDPILVYGGLELLIQYKLNEAILKHKAPAGIRFDITKFLLSKKCFACDGNRVFRLSSREGSLEEFDKMCEEDDRKDKEDKEDKEAGNSMEVDSDDIKEEPFDERLKKHLYHEKNIISLFITMPGSHINISNIKTVIRIHNIKTQFPCSWHDRVEFCDSLVQIRDEEKESAYLDYIAATFHRKGFGLFVCKGPKGANKLFIKPDINQSLKSYLKNLYAVYQDDRTDIDLDQCIQKPLTTEMLEVLYSVGVAPSYYVKQYSQRNIYKSGNNNKNQYASFEEMEDIYKKEYDYSTLVDDNNENNNNNKKRKKKNTMLYDSVDKKGEAMVSKFHGHCFRNGKDGDDIHFRIYAMEYGANGTNDDNYDNDDNDDSNDNYDDSDDDDFVSYFAEVSMDIPNTKPLETLPGEISSFFSGPHGATVKEYYLTQATRIREQISKVHTEIDPELMQWAETYEPIGDVTNYNRLQFVGQLPDSWNLRKSSKTPSRR